MTVSAELQANVGYKPTIESTTIILCELLWIDKGFGKTPAEWKGGTMR